MTGGEVRVEGLYFAHSQLAEDSAGPMVSGPGQAGGEVFRGVDLLVEAGSTVGIVGVSR